MENQFVSARERIYVSARSRFISTVYLWMFVGLLTTGLSAFLVSRSPALMSVFTQNTLVFFGLAIGLLFFVFYLSRNLLVLSANQGVALFLLYSALNGLILAPIFLLYTNSTIFTAFFMTSAIFFTMSIYGYATKTDLTSVGNLLRMGVFGLIIASVVNLFLRNSAMMMILNYAIVVIFTGLVATNTQQLKSIYDQYSESSGTIAKLSILGALVLYISFINIFLALLRIFGGSRN